MMSLMLSRIKDPRGGQGRQYPLTPLMHRLILAVLAGADSLRAMARWCHEQHEDLNRLLGTRWEKEPSVNGWHVILKALAHTDFRMSVGEASGPGLAFHIDGKVLRGSTKNRLLPVGLTSLIREDGVAVLAIAHRPGEEATIAREALRRLESEGGLKGAWLTFDALHTQKKL